MSDEQMLCQMHADANKMYMRQWCDKYRTLLATSEDSGQTDRTAFEAIAHWKDMSPFAWFQQGWKAARASSPITSPKAVNSGQTEREAFERHWYDFYHAGSISARSNGRYMQPIVQAAWEAWQARAAAPQGLTDEQRATLTKLSEHLESGSSSIFSYAAGEKYAKALRTLLADQSPAPASPSGEDAAEQSAAPMADPLRAAVESMVCMLENGEWAEHASTYKAPGDKLAARLEAAITDLHNELSGDSEQADEAVTELQNIVNAKRFDRDTFANDTEFADWVQSRARHTLGRAKEPK